MSIQYRKNINCLSSNELHSLREAFQALYNLPEDQADSFATLGGIHGDPPPMWCDHGAPGFLTWHRAYMLAFERALQAHGCNIMLPFWNWSSSPTTGVPPACREQTYVNRAGDTVPNPLYSGPIHSAAGGGTTHRRSDINTTEFGDIADSAQSAMSAATFVSFQTSINGPHGSVHIRTGGPDGHMRFTSLAGFDPIFYLHHCNVDRLWWNWQQSNPAAALPASEASYELNPFPRPFDDSWLMGSEVVNTDDWGYRYSNWCFFIPPIIVWELIPFELPFPLARQLRDARLVVRASHLPAESIEFRVFMGEEKHVRDDATKGNPAFAGSIGLFGGMGDMIQDHEHGNFDVALNLSDHIRCLCSSSDPGKEHDHRDHEDKGHDDHDHDDHDHKHGNKSSKERRAAAEETTTNVSLRIAAFDSAGTRIDPKKLDIDDIELLID